MYSPGQFGPISGDPGRARCGPETTCFACK